MKNILADASDSILNGVAGDGLLVALDFDGTLAPIVEDPALATMRETTRALLRIVSILYPTMVCIKRPRASSRDVPSRRRQA